MLRSHAPDSCSAVLELIQQKDALHSLWVSRGVSQGEGFATPLTASITLNKTTPPAPFLLFLSFITGTRPGTSQQAREMCIHISAHTWCSHTFRHTHRRKHTYENLLASLWGPLRESQAWQQMVEGFPGGARRGTTKIVMPGWVTNPEEGVQCHGHLSWVSGWAVWTTPPGRLSSPPYICLTTYCNRLGEAAKISRSLQWLARWACVDRSN